jgi:NADH dehydrogenase subunit J
MGLAQRSGTIVSRQGSVGGVGDVGSQRTGRSGMPGMPGAAAPAVQQPVLGADDAADSAAPEQKEEK